MRGPVARNEGGWRCREGLNLLQASLDITISRAGTVRSNTTSRYVIIFIVYCILIVFFYFYSTGLIPNILPPTRLERVNTRLILHKSRPTVAMVHLGSRMEPLYSWR